MAIRSTSASRRSTPFGGTSPRGTIENTVRALKVSTSTLQDEYSYTYGSYQYAQGTSPRGTIENIVRNCRTHRAAVRLAGEKPKAGELSFNAAGIVDDFLRADPAERLGGPMRRDEVRVHPFFWGFDWNSIEKRNLATPHAAYRKARATAAQKSAPPLEKLPKLK